MKIKDCFEIISEKNGYKIFKDKQLIAEVNMLVSDRDIQHAEIHSFKNGVFLTTDFDLSITRVPGLTRSVYCFDQEIGRFIYVNFDTFQCRTWQENLYSFSCSASYIEVKDHQKNKMIATIQTDPHNNHIYVEFEDCVHEQMKLMIALFPCIRFI